MQLGIIPTSINPNKKESIAQKVMLLISLWIFLFTMCYDAYFSKSIIKIIRDSMSSLNLFEAKYNGTAMNYDHAV